MKNITRNAFFLMSGDAVARLLGFFSTIYLARILGPSNFGIVTIGLSVLAYTMWLSDMGLSSLGTREFARPEPDRQYRLVDFLIARLMLALIAIAVSLMLVYVLFGHYEHAIGISLFSLSALITAIMLEWYFQGYEEARPIFLNRILFAAVYLAGILIGVTEEADVILVPLFYMTALAGGAGVMFLWKKSSDSVFSKPDVRKSTTLIRRASRVGIGSLFGQIVQTFPPLVIGVLGSETDAGRFGAASKIAFFILMIDRVFGMLFLPAVTRLFGAKDPALKAKLNVVLKYLTATGLAAAVMVFLSADRLIELIYSGRFIDTAVLLKIVAWFVPLTLLNSFYSFGLIAVGQEASYQKLMMVGGILTATAIIGLTFFYGTIGACFGMIAGELVLVLMMNRRFNMVIRTRLACHLIRPGLIGLALVAWSLISGTGMFMLAAFLVIFPLLFTASGGLRLRDWHILTGRAL